MCYARWSHKQAKLLLSRNFVSGRWLRAETGKALESVLLGPRTQVLHMPPVPLMGQSVGRSLHRQVAALASAVMTSLAGLGAEASLRAAELTQWDRDSPCC